MSVEGAGTAWPPLLCASAVPLIEQSNAITGMMMIFFIQFFPKIASSKLVRCAGRNSSVRVT
jgi:hypothetical protein